MLDQEGDKDFLELLDKYERWLIEGKDGFFDQDDLLDIIDYYYEKNEDKKIASAIDLGISLYPDNVEFTIRKAQHIHAIQAPKLALDFLLKSYSKFKDNYDYAYLLAFFYFDCQMSNKAIEIYLSLLSKNANNKEVLSSLGNTYMSDQDFKSASLVFFRLLRIEPTNENALESLSYCAQFSENADKYKEFLLTLCHKNPYSEPNWTYYGLLLYYLKLFEDAIDAFSFALSIDSNAFTAHIYKGQSLISLGNTEEGINSLLDALALSPDTSIIHLFIGKAYEQQGDFRSAINYYKSCIKYEATNSEALMGCGICYFELDEFKKGLPFIKRALKEEPNNTQYLLTYAEMLYKENYTKEGEEIYQELYDKKEELDLVTCNWAMAMASCGKNLEGITLINNTLANNTFNDPMIYLILMELSCKEEYLHDTLADELTNIFLKFPISIDIDMIKEYCPSILQIPQYKHIIKEHIHEN
jgi:Putative Zn-dependent protease, contains TPR repeats